MLIKKPADIRPSEITSHSNYLNRREFVRAGGLASGLALAGPAFSAVVPDERRAKLADVRPSIYSTDEKMNSYEDITTYNNYWEFGSGKFDPSRNSGDFDPLPWQVTVDGHCEKTGTFDFDDFIKPFDLEERIYRMRCVEAWSMVIPWVGISLAEVVKHYQPTSKAKYVAFQALHDPTRMPGQRQRLLDWPYREGLTIAEATNPLPILAVGLYGEAMPNPNGAPIRLVVPLEIWIQRHQGHCAHQFHRGATALQLAALAGPTKYGFYSNVNPEVDHPRWSQATERRIGGGVFAPRIPTRMLQWLRRTCRAFVRRPGPA